MSARVAFIRLGASLSLVPLDAESQLVAEVCKALKAFLADRRDRYCYQPFLDIYARDSFCASFIGDALEERIRAVILSCFPKQSEEKTLDEVLLAFSVAERSKVLAFAIKCMQGELRSWKPFIAAMQNGRSPTIVRASDRSFSTQLQAAVWRLGSYSEPGASAGTAKSLLGSAGAKAKLKAVLAGSKDALRYNDLQLASKFAFVLDTQGRESLTKKKSELMAKFNMKEGSIHPDTDKIGKPQQTMVHTPCLVNALLRK